DAAGLPPYAPRWRPPHPLFWRLFRPPAVPAPATHRPATGYSAHPVADPRPNPPCHHVSSEPPVPTTTTRLAVGPSNSWRGPFATFPAGPLPNGAGWTWDKRMATSYRAVTADVPL